MHHVIAVKETQDIFPPTGSVIINVDGKYAIANHWPPGYCYLIIPFWISGLIDFINIVTGILACCATYILAKRLFTPEIGLVAAGLVLVSGLTMVMIYQRGMADLAAVAFATLGIALFIEIQHQEKSTKFGRIFSMLLGFIWGFGPVSPGWPFLPSPWSRFSPFLYVATRPYCSCCASSSSSTYSWT